MVFKKDPSDPLYAFKSSFGVQAYAHRKTEPLYSFGKSLGDVHVPLSPSSSPGPGAHLRDRPVTTGSEYPVNYKWGAQVTQRNTFALPAYSFRGTPGPGKYNACTNAIVGHPNPCAAVENVPSFTWSRSCTRESHSRQYVSREHEREMIGVNSPGPATVGRDCFQSMGHQLSSSRRSNPRFAPPKERRFFKIPGLLTPGPGAYDI